MRLKHRRLTPTNFAIFLRFSKNVSGGMLPEQHRILLKTAPIAFLVNVSNTGYQNVFVLFSFLRSAYGKFEDISIETYQSFSSALVLSPL